MEGGRDKATPHNFYRILVDSGLGESRWLCGRPSAGMPYPILSNEFEGPGLCMGLSMRRPSEATSLASFVAQKVAVSLGMRASCLSDNFAPLRLLSLSLFLSFSPLALLLSLSFAIARSRPGPTRPSPFFLPVEYYPFRFLCPGGLCRLSLTDSTEPAFSVPTHST